MPRYAYEPTEKIFHLGDKAFSLQQIIKDPKRHSGQSKFKVKQGSKDSDSLVSFKIKDFFYDEQDCQMLIMTDLTQTQEIDQLQKDKDVMSVLQACVSHELRAPLKAIDVCVELVLRTLNLTEEQIKLIDPIRFSS
jgi:hypothetical protein